MDPALIRAEHCLEMAKECRRRAFGALLAGDVARCEALHSQADEYYDLVEQNLEAAA